MVRPKSKVYRHYRTLTIEGKERYKCLYCEHDPFAHNATTMEKHTYEKCEGYRTMIARLTPSASSQNGFPFSSLEDPNPTINTQTQPSQSTPSHIKTPLFSNTPSIKGYVFHATPKEKAALDQVWANGLYIDGLPFCTFEKPGFKQAMQQTLPGWKPPCERASLFLCNILYSIH
eukprot:TRINITY_DN4676_c0_g1_i1.p1 TRINITY_DN4676_c0_g1~~TRINITY_DN4676_c0_g1_i1.p1  ORF type:complete len:174 (+),score=32.49 TRINITY_DN4676_c0_g1_i1:324-845(+)